jgi:hypothetical protein
LFPQLAKTRRLSSYPGPGAVREPGQEDFDPAQGLPGPVFAVSFEVVPNSGEVLLFGN